MLSTSRRCPRERRSLKSLAVSRRRWSGRGTDRADRRWRLQLPKMLEPTRGLEPRTARLQVGWLAPTQPSEPVPADLTAVIPGMHGSGQQVFMDRLSTVDSPRGYVAPRRFGHDPRVAAPHAARSSGRIGAGSGNRSRSGSRYSPARKRSMSSTPMTAPRAARRTAHAIAARPSAKVIPRGTPNAATTGLAITPTTTTAADRKASIHMTARNVRS